MLEDKDVAHFGQIDLFKPLDSLIKEADHRYNILLNKTDIIKVLAEVALCKKVALQVFCDTSDALTTNIAGYAISTKKTSYYIVHSEDNIKLFGYKAGTWGPKKCDDLFRNQNTWRYPCKNLVNDGEICEL